MGKYKVSWFNLGSGKMVNQIVEAKSEEEALEIADPPVVADISLVNDGTIMANDIFDAEWLLYEMDAHNKDEILVKESGKTRKYTRAEVENSLNLKTNRRVFP